MKKGLLRAGASLMAVSIASFSTAMAQARDFDIDAGPAEKTLNQFASQADVSVVYTYDAVEGYRTNDLDGSYEPEDALKLMTDGTGLSVFEGEGGAFAVRVVKTAAADSSLIRVAQLNQEDDVQEVSTRNDDDETEQDVIIVTGTNIRGAAPVGSDPFVFSRDDIDRAGFSTPQDLFRVLPQNTGIGGNEITSASFISNNDANLNTSLGSGINLRGLGTQSTLTLINGRRVASNNFGTLTDISLIPLVSLDRVEVLADGASAIYGSDAVGGVVNFILRSDFDGAETRFRYGTVTDGIQDEYQASQIFGTTWDSGDVVIAYEYYKRDALPSSDREFAANADLTSLGGDDLRTRNSNPGTIRAGGTTFAIPGGQDGTSLAPSDLIAGTANFGNQREGTFVLPSQERHSAFVALNQKLTDGASVFLEGRYATREFETRTAAFETNLTVPASNAFFVDPVGGLSSYRIRYSFIDDLGPQTSNGEVEAYNIVAGANFELSRTWRAEVFGSYNRENEDVRSSGLPNRFLLAGVLADSDPSTAFNPFGDGSNSNPSTIDAIRGFFTADRDSELWSVQAKADGALFLLPGGEMRAAVGLEYREESLKSAGIDFRNSAAPIDDPLEEFGRDVFAAFGEIFVPLVGANNRRPGLENIELSAAVRFEDYSDFGSTTNPKFGARWSPSEGFNIRGTWGTSFRAPGLRLLDTSGNGIFLTNIIPDPMATDGNTQTAVFFGNDDDIGPENATVWTVGADYSPPSIPNLAIKLTYFDISYEDRIAGLFGNLISVFTNEDQFAPIITRNVDPATAQMILNSPDLTSNFCGCTEVEAIVNVRDANVSVTEVSGFDATIAYDFETDFGEFDLFLNGSYYLSFDEALTSTAPLVETLDTVGNPVDLRLRGSMSWAKDGFSAAAFVNYVDSYTDNTTDPSQKIESYTTVDLRLSYELGESVKSALLKDTEIALTMNNVFDQDPPFFNNRIRAIGFDPEQSNPQGRFIAVQLSKRW